MIEMQYEKDTFAGEFTDKTVKVIETEYGQQLPNEFIEFLKKYNGVEPIHKEIVLAGELCYMERFLAIVEDYKHSKHARYDMAVYTNNSIEYYVEDGDSTQVPFVPFLELSDEDTVCFDYRENRNKPSIVKWSKRESEEEHPVTTPVAGSFHDFLDILEQSQPTDDNEERRP